MWLCVREACRHVKLPGTDLCAGGLQQPGNKLIYNKEQIDEDTCAGSDQPASTVAPMHQCACNFQLNMLVHRQGQKQEMARVDKGHCAQ